MIRNIKNLHRISKSGFLSNRVNFSQSSNITINYGQKENNNKNNENTNTKYYRIFLFASVWVTIKDYFGIEKVNIEHDPVRGLVKKAWYCVKDRKFNDAIEILEEALKIAHENKDEKIVTRIYTELGDTYLKMEDFNKAEDIFKVLLQRFIHLHKYPDSHPAFISTSIKLATVFANKGNVDNAEIGFKHAISKQMKCVDEHLKKNVVAYGAHSEEKNIVDSKGYEFTDPLALFGFALDSYAHFLVNHREEERLNEAEECMDEALKIAYTIFGSNNYHIINMLKNFSSACIEKKYFKTAKKYLEIGIQRVVNSIKDQDIIVEYYCNYAVSLLQTGEKEKALEYTERALSLSKSCSTNIKKLAEENLLIIKNKCNISNKEDKTKWFYFF
uniref:TPR_REGION domain-containing protein n=1 Tax=Parastrongyloides trichosuri TaxID=131310 RepID=A0A0N5A538_PARTI